ncbi:MAG: type I pullulanase [Alkaliphilus sp.]
MKIKKIFSVLLVAILFTSLFFGTISFNEVHAETTTTIVVNYNRPDADYGKWNLWVWVEGEDGEVFFFEEETDFGVRATIELPGDVRKAGFIVRTDAWEKDVDVDRSIEIEDGFAEIWVNSGQEKFVYDNPKVDASIDNIDHEEIQLNIHYHRFDNEYEGWNLWMWKEGQDGLGLDFTEEDEYGKIARVTLDDMADVKKIGFIVRKSEDGNEWAAKDIDEDRFIAAARASEDGIINIFLMQQTKKIGFEVEDMDRSPRIVTAVLGEATVIEVEVNVPFRWEDNIRELFKLESETVKGQIEEVKPLDMTDDNYVRKISVVTSEPLELSSTYKLSMLGYGAIEISPQSCAIFSGQEFYDEFHYYGDDLGAIYSKVETIFRVWAPTASEVNLLLFEEGIGGEAKQEIAMIRDTKGTWLLKVEGDLKDTFYVYEVHVNDSVNEVTDPYAKAVGVNGRRAMVVDLSKTNPAGWENLAKPHLENFTDVVIYELHVRDLSMNENSGIVNKGKFLGIIEEGTQSLDGKKTGLAHMKELGITHLHLLPVFDFRSVDETTLEKNNFNWGYDPQNYNVPEGSYSTNPYCGATRIKEFKQMVQGLNENGIRVIMDVVYNHTGYTANSHLNLLVPGYFYRFTPDGRFSNGSGCGNEIADERSMGRKMIVDSVVFWATEYKIDGFRFDLMGLHDIETMNLIREELDKIDPTILIYGEGWTAGSTPLPSHRQALKVNTPKLNGIASFSDDLRDGVKGHVFNDEEAGFVNGGLGFEESVKFGIVASTQHDQIDYSKVNYSNAPWATEPAQAINYVSAHDNLTLWDKIAISNPKDSEEERIKMHKLSNAIVLTSQGIAFLHAGVEMLRTKGGDHNSYQSPDSVNMLDWSRKTAYNQVFRYHKGLIELRKQRLAFRMTSTEDIQKHLRFLEMPQNNMVGYTLTDNANGDEWETIAVLFNVNTEDIEVTLPAKGWGVVVNGETAGIEILENISNDRVTVLARTAMVLVQDDTLASKSLLHVYLGGAILGLLGLYLVIKKFRTYKETP